MVKAVEVIGVLPVFLVGFGATSIEVVTKKKLKTKAKRRPN